MVVSAHNQELGQQESLLRCYADQVNDNEMRRKRRKQNSINDNLESCDETSDEDTTITALDRVDLEDQQLEQKMELLKKQIEQLEAGILPDYQKRIKKIEQKRSDWLKMMNLRYENEVQWLEKQAAKEKAQFESECHERKQELKESLLADIEEQKRRVENEIGSMEIVQNGHGTKTISRKISLRRRAADPPPAVEKRRKTTGPNLLVFRLSEEEVDEDLMTLTRFSGNKQLARRAAAQLQSSSSLGSNGYAHTASSASASAGLFTRQQAVASIFDGTSGNGSGSLFEARIDQSTRRLYYEKRWYAEGQPVFVETKLSEQQSAAQASSTSSDSRRPGTLVSVVGNEVAVKLLGSNQRMKISLRQLNLGRYTIRKRAV